MKNDARHQCLIYAGPPSHKLPALAAVMKQMMDDGYRCLYLNSPMMVAGIRSALAALDVDVATEIAAGRLIFSSETVSGDDEFDVDRMLQLLENTLDEALRDGYNGLWATGDMSWEFGSEKNFDKLLEYELKLESLFQRRKELQGICQYHRDTLPQQAMRHGILSHPGVFINNTLCGLNPFYLQTGLWKDGISVTALDKMIAELCGAQ